MPLRVEYFQVESSAREQNKEKVIYNTLHSDTCKQYREHKGTDG
jgi:hypothetical protein